MSLPHVLLGMLATPASGYDLKKDFGESISHFWSAELSQIYPALNRLEKDGLLRSELVPSDKGPPRKVYERTARGGEVLVEWLTGGPAEQGQDRLSFLAQVFFLDAVPPEQRVRFIERLRTAFAARLAALEHVEADWRACDPLYPDRLPDEGFYPHLTLRFGLAKLRTMVDWCDEALEGIARREQAGSTA